MSSFLNTFTPKLINFRIKVICFLKSSSGNNPLKNTICGKNRISKREWKGQWFCKTWYTPKLYEIYLTCKHIYFCLAYTPGLIALHRSALCHLQTVDSHSSLLDPDPSIIISITISIIIIHYQSKNDQCKSKIYQIHSQ